MTQDRCPRCGETQWLFSCREGKCRDRNDELRRIRKAATERYERSQRPAPLPLSSDGEYPRPNVLLRMAIVLLIAITMGSVVKGCECLKEYENTGIYPDKRGGTPTRSVVSGVRG